MTYGKTLGILLALSAVLAGAWKLYDAIGDSRENEVRLELAGEREALVKKIKHQNDEIEALKTKGQLQSSQAAGRATTALLEGEKQKRNLPKGTGPKAMNEFMRAVFQ